MSLGRFAISGRFVTGCIRASFALLCASAASGQTPADTRVPAPPTLVVFITVDQLSPVYFDRFGAQFTGGLARLLRRGAVQTSPS